MPLPHSLLCLCGAVNIKLNGQPEARANCHCLTCRDFYGTSMLSATAWLPEQVTVVGGRISTFSHPTKQLSRAFCPRCGDTVFGTNRFGMRVLPNSFVARATGGELPEEMRATMHLFYRHRTIDIQDELPKYLDGWDGQIYDGSSGKP
ncbi:GFA family protein [Paraburkholderia sediminicola]|uniref:GFA family protein n=1 Tax=Paraburkholderia sediminicola TaxID=458836 RepID=UPI0038BA5227